MIIVYPFMHICDDEEKKVSRSFWNAPTFGTIWRIFKAPQPDFRINLSFLDTFKIAMAKHSKQINNNNKQNIVKFSLRRMENKFADETRFTDARSYY
jgi:hypothetical protein